MEMIIETAETQSWDAYDPLKCLGTNHVDVQGLIARTQEGRGDFDSAPAGQRIAALCALLKVEIALAPESGLGDVSGIVKSLLEPDPEEDIEGASF